MKHEELKIVYRESLEGEQGQMIGIRDKSGFLLFFPNVTRYPDQEGRYIQELDEQEELANYLLESLEEKP